ncbi:MAG TPA: UvrD-helicase domain-containing protein [Pirellulaceae bacterium]|nr:UvrD-helicase domain-containing protein [Pirellulaceae bacterium]
MSHLVIRASAGSGKTFQLSNRFLGLIHGGAPVDSILASTFTRAAASEVRSRVLFRLAQAATSPRDLTTLAGAVPGGATLDRERCFDLLAELVRNLHRLRVSTLDAFFIQIAKSFSLEIGLPAGWRIVDDLEDARMRSEAIAAVLAEEDHRDLSRLLNLMAKGESQRSISDVLRDTVRNVYTVYCESDVEAWQRFPHSSPMDEAALTTAILAMECSPMPEAKLAIKAREKDVVNARAGEWEKFVAEGLAKYVAQGQATYSRKEIPAAMREAYAPLLAHARNVALSRIAAQTGATWELMHRFHLRYERLKLRRRGYRFEDVTRRVGRFFARPDHDARTDHDARPSQGAGGESFDRSERSERIASRAGHAPPIGLERLSFRLDARTEHLLLDEFQDTSVDQWRVLRPIAEHVTSDSAKRRSFFCVGDVKQAIYGWRGGVAEIFDAIERQLRGLKTEGLNTSYRSSQPVIDVVNLAFRDARKHDNLGRSQRAVEAWCEAFPVHSTARTELAGYVTLETTPGEAVSEESTGDESGGDEKGGNESSRDSSSGGESSGGDESDVATTMSHFAYVARKIQQYVTEAPGRKVGVLVRTNDAVAELIFELRRLQVPASEEGGNPLTDAAAVQVALSALELADHPGHSIARFHVVHSPLAKLLGVDDIVNVRAAQDGPRWTRVAAEIRAELLERGYGATIDRWSRALAPSCNGREWRRLSQLVQAAYQYESSATLRTSDFVRAVSSKRVADPSSDDVVVTTIHKSKGLQYDIVVLPELDGLLLGQTPTLVVGREDPISPINAVCRYVNQSLREVLPESLAGLFGQADDLKTTEALSVLYVALTRAVHALHMFIGLPKENEKKLPKTAAGLVRAALNPTLAPHAETVLFEHGDRQWFRQPKKSAARATTAGPSKTAREDKPSEVALSGGASSGLVSSDVAPSPGAAPAPALIVAPVEGAPLRGWRRVTPSSLEGGRKVQLAARFQGDGNEGSDGRRRGTAMHSWFERIEWLDSMTVPEDEELLRAAARALDVTTLPLELDRWLGEFREMLRKPSVAAVLSRATYSDLKALGFSSAMVKAATAKAATGTTTTGTTTTGTTATGTTAAGTTAAGTTAAGKVAAGKVASGLRCEVVNERSFAVRHEGRLLVGTIDRLVEIYRDDALVGLDIVDFKTDFISEGDEEALAAKVAYYRPQVEAYREAMMLSTGLASGFVRCRLVFLALGRVVPV